MVSSNSAILCVLRTSIDLTLARILSRRSLVVVSTARSFIGLVFSADAAAVVCIPIALSSVLCKSRDAVRDRRDLLSITGGRG